MLTGIPKISVYIITYNQEDVIERTLASILSQIDYVYEICVSDDCSSDRTWEILLEYSHNYPGLFRLERNDPNLGIFENTEKVWSLPSGDLVFDLAGDDCVCDNWFKTVVEFIQEHKIDYKNEKICIAGDYINIYPNGDSFIIRNNHITKQAHPLRLYERGLVKTRSNVFSINVLRCFERVSQGRSYIAENAQDCQVYLFANKFYYIPQVGSVYYCGIGTGSRMNPEKMKEHEQTMVYAFDFLKVHGAIFSRADNNLPQYNIAQKHVRWYPSLRSYFSLVYWYLKSFDFPLSLYGLDIKAKLFALCRRFPHKKPINW